MNTKNPIVFKCMIVIGIILLLTSCFLGYSRIKFLENSVKTEGVVVKYVEAGTVTSSLTSARISRMMYAPVVTFNSSDGKTFEFRSAVSSNNKPYSIGDKVRVVYLQDNPSIAEIYSFTRMWLLSLGILFGGIVVLLMGIVGLKHPERITTYG